MLRIKKKYLQIVSQSPTKANVKKKEGFQRLN